MSIKASIELVGQLQDQLLNWFSVFFDFWWSESALKPSCREFGVLRSEILNLQDLQHTDLPEISVVRQKRTGMVVDGSRQVNGVRRFNIACRPYF
jgi:hypothetical protein